MSLTNFPSGITSFGQLVPGSGGMGNIYYVVNSADTAVYSDIYQRLAGQAYSDGSQILYTHTASGATVTLNGIQSALDACVANRNDYVIVLPSNSDYDLAAALTMSKNRVHLVCPPGIGWGGMPGNSARIHQNTATTQNIVVTADCVEIAGLFFKGYDGTAKDAPSIIHLSGTRWTPNIHDNFFGCAWTATGTGYGILADGACSHFSIRDNYFTNYGPTLLTGAANTGTAFIGITSSSSTRGLISGNQLLTGPNTTCSGIITTGPGFVIKDNIIMESVAFSTYDAGVLTKGINSSVDTFCVGNRFQIATGGDSITGATANKCCVDNWQGDSGNTIVESV